MKPEDMVVFYNTNAREKKGRPQNELKANIILDLMVTAFRGYYYLTRSSTTTTEVQMQVRRIEWRSKKLRDLMKKFDTVYESRTEHEKMKEFIKLLREFRDEMSEEKTMERSEWSDLRSKKKDFITQVQQNKLCLHLDRPELGKRMIATSPSAPSPIMKTKRKGSSVVSADSDPTMRYNRKGSSNMSADSEMNFVIDDLKQNYKNRFGLPDTPLGSDQTAGQAVSNPVKTRDRPGSRSRSKTPSEGRSSIGSGLASSIATGDIARVRPVGRPDFTRRGRPPVQVNNHPSSSGADAGGYASRRTQVRV